MNDIPFLPDPYSVFHIFYKDAQTAEPSDPDAACLATVDQDGLPNARVVLVRKIDPKGFCFFTNYNSAKGQELTASGKAALNFHWKSLKRQVRIRGTVEKLSTSESDEYYHSRPIGNRLGAWASLQSTPLADKNDLVTRFTEFEQKFGDSPPRPDHWGGFRLSPISIEFWQEGEARLHQRLKYHLKDTVWVAEKLYP